MKTTLQMISAGWSLLALSACSLAAPRTQNIQVWADSPTAAIFVNGRESGRGNCTITLPRNKPAVFRAVDGTKQSSDILLEPELSLYGYADLASWWLLLPPLGLTAPGAWQLPQDTVPLHLPQY